MPSLRQNELDRAIGMFAALTSVTHSASLFGCSRITFHSLVGWYNQTGNTNEVLRLGLRK